MTVINLISPWSDKVLAGVADMINVYTRPERANGLFVVHSINPFIDAQLTLEQQHVTNNHMVMGNYSPQKYPNYGQIAGVVQIAGGSNQPNSIWDLGPEYYKLKVVKAYRFLHPMKTSKSIEMYSDIELPSLESLVEVMPFFPSIDMDNFTLPLCKHLFYTAKQGRYLTLDATAFIKNILINPDGKLKKFSTITLKYNQYKRTFYLDDRSTVLESCEVNCHSKSFAVVSHHQVIILLGNEISPI